MSLLILRFYVNEEHVIHVLSSREACLYVLFVVQDESANENKIVGISNK